MKGPALYTTDENKKESPYSRGVDGSFQRRIYDNGRVFLTRKAHKKWLKQQKKKSNK